MTTRPTVIVVMTRCNEARIGRSPERCLAGRRPGRSLDTPKTCRRADSQRGRSVGDAPIGFERQELVSTSDQESPVGADAWYDDDRVRIERHAIRPSRLEATLAVDGAYLRPNPRWVGVMKQDIDRPVGGDGRRGRAANALRVEARRVHVGRQAIGPTRQRT